MQKIIAIAAVSVVTATTQSERAIAERRAAAEQALKENVTMSSMLEELRYAILDFAFAPKGFHFQPLS